MRSWSVGSTMIVCRQSPPAPGAHPDAVLCVRIPGSSVQLVPASFDWNNAASSAPAYTASASSSEGSRCHTRLNSYGCGDPSYHVCGPTSPSYRNWLPTVSHVLPASLERCITWPNQPLDCEA